MRLRGGMHFHETKITVDAHGIDPLWHGHFVAWMEEGRSDLVSRFGLDARAIAASGYIMPVVQLDMQFIKPLRFDRVVRVQTGIQRTYTATIVFISRVIGEDDVIAATGKAVYAITDATGVLQYTLPAKIMWGLGNCMAYLDHECPKWPLHGPNRSSQPTLPLSA